VLEAIRGGSTRKAAALHAGIDEHTLYNWLKAYSSFSSALTRAEADVEVRCTALILNAATTDPRHAEWWLERRRPDDYGRRERLEQDINAQALNVTVVFDRQHATLDDNYANGKTTLELTDAD